MLLSLALLAVILKSTAASLSVHLQPVAPQSTTRDTSRAVACRFQVVAGSEKEWSSSMQVCIWVAVSSDTVDAVPNEAQCAHGVVGNAMFAVSAHGIYSISAVVVQDDSHGNKRGELLSAVATITIDTNSKTPAPKLRSIQVQGVLFVVCWWRPLLAIVSLLTEFYFYELASQHFLEQTTDFNLPAYGIRGPIPWKAIPKALQDEYSMHGYIPVVEWFLFGQQAPPPEDGPIVYPESIIPVWTTAILSSLTDKAANRVEDNSSFYGHVAPRDLYAAFDAYPVTDRTVLVIGSLTPWVEAIVAAYGKAKLPVYTVDFNKPIVEDAEMQSSFKTLSISELDELIYSGQRFDAVISYSSIEHDGKFCATSIL
jgi:hypothetical protein